MSEEKKWNIEIGDWVRYEHGQQLKIAQVEYIVEGEWTYRERAIMTDSGCIRDELILEVRKK